MTQYSGKDWKYQRSTAKAGILGAIVWSTIQMFNYFWPFKLQAFSNNNIEYIFKWRNASLPTLKHITLSQWEKQSWLKSTYLKAFVALRLNRSTFWCRLAHYDSSWCYKTFFGGNLDFPKIKKLKKVCSDVWTCTKMWKQC